MDVLDLMTPPAKLYQAAMEKTRHIPQEGSFVSCLFLPTQSQIPGQYDMFLSLVAG
jgi:hypothetical protein